MGLNEQQKDKVKNLLRRGNKVQAIKFLKDNFDISLKEAKYLAEELEGTLDHERYPLRGYSIHGHSSLKNKNKLPQLICGIFVFVGLIFLSIVAFIYITDADFMKKAVMVKGIVVETPHQPLFEYEYNGQIYKYQIATASNPPAYFLGEEAEIYVNPDFPQEVLVNTFSGRWFTITVLGGLGGLFVIIGMATYYFFKR